MSEISLTPFAPWNAAPSGIVALYHWYSNSLHACRQTDGSSEGKHMRPTFFVDRLNVGRSEPATDPLLAPIKDIVERLEDGAISTAALLTLLGMRPSTDNARRVAPIMRQLNFLPWKSHRLQGGAGRGPECRGWLRPVRPLKHPAPAKPTAATAPASAAPPAGADAVQAGGTVKPFHARTAMNEQAQQ
jgi:hypothetical protein